MSVSSEVRAAILAELHRRKAVTVQQIVDQGFSSADVYEVLRELEQQSKVPASPILIRKSDKLAG